MVEPEEPAPLRRVFEELEAEFEAGLRREAEQETVAAIRAQVGATNLWEQLARHVGTEAVARAGAHVVRGTVAASYPDFFVLQDPEGGQHLVRVQASSLALSPGHEPLQPAPSSAAGRFHLALALRELARRREPVRLELVDGNTVHGTIEAVGSDYLELAEHEVGEARREAVVRARRFAAFAAIAFVSLLPDRR
ncbi:MAG TPA: hypothetical protein VNK73_05820 [Actinomycetota bacterium]|jgi:hypothetical protein|nr:hypothetical protein [Actinomycetota bacterium]